MPQSLLGYVVQNSSRGWQWQLEKIDGTIVGLPAGPFPTLQDALDAVQKIASEKNIPILICDQ